MATKSSGPEETATSRAPAGWEVPLIIAVAVAVRIAYLLNYMHSPYAGFFQTDQRLYVDWAVLISQGDWLGKTIFTQGPLYAYLLGSLFVITGPMDLPVLCLQLTAGTATCLLVFDCARRLFDRPTALTAALMASVYGPFVFYECMVLKTFLSPLLTVLTLWAALRYCEHRSLRWMLLAGASIGLACLVRESHVLLLIPVIWWCWYVSGLKKGGRPPTSWGRGQTPFFSPPWIRHAAAMLLMCLAVIAPCSVRNAWVGSEFVAVTSGGGEVFYLAHGPYASGYYGAPPFVRADPRFEHDDFRQQASRRAGRPQGSPPTRRPGRPCGR